MNSFDYLKEITMTDAPNRHFMKGVPLSVSPVLFLRQIDSLIRSSRDLNITPQQLLTTLLAFSPSALRPKVDFGWFLIPGGSWSVSLQDPREKFKVWSQQYGDIFSLRLGPHVMVVISSYQLLKEAFVKHGNVFSHRPDMFVLTHLAKKRGAFAAGGGSSVLILI